MRCHRGVGIRYGGVVGVTNCAGKRLTSIARAGEPQRTSGDFLAAFSRESRNTSDERERERRPKSREVARRLSRAVSPR